MSLKHEIPTETPRPTWEVLFGRSPSDDTSDLGTYTATTRADGRAKTTLILENNAAGVYRVSAWRTDDGTLTAIFTVTVDAIPLPRSTITTTTTTDPLREPTTLEKISGDNQEGIAGTVLADPFVVEVRDQDGEPLSRVTVTFTVSAGRGAMGVVTSRTDSDGRVASVMTLSTEPGINRVWVNAEDLDQTLIFNAEGTAPPSEPMSDEDEETIPPITEPMPDEEEVIPPITEPMPSLTFDLALPMGLNLIHIPLKVRAVDGMPAGIESVSDLYDVLGGAATVNWLIRHDSVTQEWHGYFGDGDRGSIADSALADQTGILVSTKARVSIRLSGDALGVDGMSAITLSPGLNLVGLPLNDPTLIRVSDLWGLEGIGGVVTAIIVTDNGEFKLVGRAGDLGDIPITGGQGFILIVQRPVTIPITGTGWDHVP